MATRMQQRRGTAAQWTSASPILAAGEIGFETDTGKFKMGNGSSAWSALSYFTDSSDFDTASIEATIDSKVADAVNDLVAGAPAALNTLNELADAIDNDSAFASTITGILLTKASQTQLDTHEAQTTSVHGIANTAELETQTGAQAKANAAEAAAALDATTKANAAQAAAIAAAETDALAKANAAEGAAIAAAALDATTKANAAQAAAIAAAETDALAKANAAEAAATAAAIAAAALDATTKATDAEANAVAAISPAISAHNSDTTGVHGITDTSLLATTTDVSTAQSAAQGYADSAISAHNTDSTNVHGIADTADLVLTNDARLSDERTPLDGSVTDAKIDPTSLLSQSSILNLPTDLAAKAPLESPTFTGTVVLPTTTAGGSIVPSVDNTYDLGSPTAMWKDLYVGPGSLYVNGQKVLQDESGNIVVSADADENISIRTSGSGNVELDATGTGNIQIKSAMVIEGGSNITSSDGNAIVFGNAISTDTISSKTTNTDLSLSANGTGKVYLNDNAEVNGNLVVGGNLTVSGTTTTVNSETISLADNIIDLNSNFTTGTPTENSGLRIKRGDSSDVQLRWNETSDVWEFTNDGTNYSTITPLNSPTFTGTVSGITKSMVGLGNVDNTSDADKPISTATQTALNAKASTSDLESATLYSFNAQTASYSLALADSTNMVTVNSASATTVTVPANSSVAFPVGTYIDIFQLGTGQVTVAAGSGVTIYATPGYKLRTQYSGASLVKRDTNTWYLTGDIVA